jgi:hypothetical protein
MIFYFPDENRWVAVSSAFQSQCFHTDESTGHRNPQAFDVPAADGRVRTLAAIANPIGPDLGLESITVLNTTPKPIDLSSWKIADTKVTKAPGRPCWSSFRE